MALSHPALTAPQQSLVAEGAAWIPRLAKKIGLRYGMLVSAVDLEGFGLEGLIAAAQAFDPTHGASFYTFGFYRARGAMLDAVRKEARERKKRAIIALEVAASDRLSRFQDAVSPLEDTQELATRRLQTFTSDLAATMFVSYAAELARGADERAIEAEEHQAAIASLKHAMGTLPPREQALVRLHYLEGRTLRDVAGELKVSYASVRRYHDRVVAQLGQALRAAGVEGAPPTKGAD